MTGDDDDNFLRWTWVWLDDWQLQQRI
jgi:hypothetical protein